MKLEQTVSYFTFHGDSPMSAIKARTVEKLELGVDYTRETREVLLFNKYQQVFPTDEQLGKLTDGCESTVAFDIIEECLLANGKSFELGVGYYFVQSKDGVERKLSSKNGLKPETWLVDRLEPIFEYQKCKFIILHKTLGSYRAALDYIDTAESLASAKRKVIDFLGQSDVMDEVCIVVDRLYNTYEMRNLFKQAKDDRQGGSCKESVCYLFGFYPQNCKRDFKISDPILICKGPVLDPPFNKMEI